MLLHASRCKPQQHPGHEHPGGNGAGIPGATVLLIIARYGAVRGYVSAGADHDTQGPILMHTAGSGSCKDNAANAGSLRAKKKSLRTANKNERSLGRSPLHDQDMGKYHRNSIEQWLAVGGWWRLAVGGWWSLGAVLKGCP